MKFPTARHKKRRFAAGNFASAKWGGFAKIALHSRNGKTIMGLRRFKKLGPEEVQK